MGGPPDAASFAVLCELCEKGIRSRKERYVNAKLAKDRKAAKQGSGTPLQHYFFFAGAPIYGS